MGATLTYARRYALASVIGNSSDEDDDGNSASGVHDKPAYRNSVSTPFDNPGIGTTMPLSVLHALTYSGTKPQKETLIKMCTTAGITDHVTMGAISKALTGKPMADMDKVITEFKEAS